MMESKKRVSIIVVTYNHAHNIAKCLDSLIEQETSFSFEIIIADDASTDGTSQIVRDYAERYPAIVIPIIQSKNIGPGANFQAALRCAESEYIAYCDGDDYWCNSHKLEIAVDILDKNLDCTIFLHNTNTHNVSTGSVIPIVNDEWKASLKDNKFSLTESQYTHISARVFRKTEFPNLGDTFMYHYLLSQGKGYYHDEVMSVYNYSGMGIWSKLSPAEQASENYKLFQFLNSEFAYKYDRFYTNLMPKSLRMYKLLFGKKRGWEIFVERSKSLLSRKRN